MELKNVAILGASGFIGRRTFINLSGKYKIIKVEKKFKLKKNLKIQTLICCSGPNKFWCLENKKTILKESKKFAVNLINFCEQHDIKNLIYCSSIQVLNKKDNLLMPYIKWHRNIENHLKKLKVKKKIIRLPNIFGKPEKNKKNFWNFFINSIIKNSYLKKGMKIKNKPKQIIFAMPLNYFIKFLEKEIDKKFIYLNKTINLNKYYKFKTVELIYIINKILIKKGIHPKIDFTNNSSKDFTFKNTMSADQYLFFNKEIEGLLRFVKTLFNQK